MPGLFLLLPVFEQVADFGQQDLLLRGSGRSDGGCRFALADQPVHEFDHQKDAEGQDSEIHALLDECAVIPPDRFRRNTLRRTRPDCVGHYVCRFRGEVAHLADVEPQRREVRIADQRADRGHDDVVHQRGDDLAERAADDNADGHVHDVALEGELAEFLEKCHVDAS